MDDLSTFARFFHFVYNNNNNNVIIIIILFPVVDGCCVVSDVLLADLPPRYVCIIYIICSIYRYTLYIYGVIGRAILATLLRFPIRIFSDNRDNFDHSVYVMQIQRRRV